MGWAEGMDTPHSLMGREKKKERDGEEGIKEQQEGWDADFQGDSSIPSSFPSHPTWSVAAALPLLHPILVPYGEKRAAVQCAVGFPPWSRALTFLLVPFCAPINPPTKPHAQGPNEVPTYAPDSFLHQHPIHARFTAPLHPA